LTSGAPTGDPAGRALPVLEIGGTHVTAALVELNEGSVNAGSLLRASLNPGGSSAELLGAVIGCGNGLEVRGEERWGVAIPGPFDYERGIGLFADVGKFESLYGVDVRAALLAGLPGPPGSIVFLNDADAFLWGEWLFGAAAGHERCVGITLGTGIGSAFIADGDLRHDGPGVPPEGRVDLLHIRGMALEEVVSARAIERLYQERTGVVPDGTAFVARQARNGDDTAASVLSTSFEQLGQALRPWLEEFGASILVIGGSMTGSWDLIGPALSQGLGSAKPIRRGQPAHGGQVGGAASLTGLTVAVAARPEHAALLGAAAYAQRTARGTHRPALAPNEQLPAGHDLPGGQGLRGGQARVAQ
jgi:glucokinase